MEKLGYDEIKYCPVCKQTTPHDTGLMVGNCRCNVCGVVRSSRGEGAFRKCMDCGDWMPAKKGIGPEHKCR